MAARRFVRRSFAAAGNFLGGHGILNLDLTCVDQTFHRLVRQVLIRDVPGLTGPQVKSLTPWQSHSKRLMCLVQNGFHDRPPANEPIVFYPGSPQRWNTPGPRFWIFSAAARGVVAPTFVIGARIVGARIVRARIVLALVVGALIVRALVIPIDRPADNNSVSSLFFQRDGIVFQT